MFMVCGSVIFLLADFWTSILTLFFSESVTTVMANIHKFVLLDCRQMPWAGEQTEEVTLTQVKVNEKKKDQMKVQTLKLPNLLYSKGIILKQIK